MMELLCADCLDDVTKSNSAAVTIWNGYALCELHTRLRIGLQRDSS